MFVIHNVIICYTYYYNKMIHVNYILHRELLNVTDGQWKNIFIIVVGIINNFGWVVSARD